MQQLAIIFKVSACRVPDQNSVFLPARVEKLTCQEKVEKPSCVLTYQMAKSVGH